MSEHLVDVVIRTVEREVGPVTLYARIELERVVNAAIDDALWHRHVDWNEGETTDEPK
jgi:hypothetical protein